QVQPGGLQVISDRGRRVGDVSKPLCVVSAWPLTHTGIASRTTRAATSGLRISSTAKSTGTPSSSSTPEVAELNQHLVSPARQRSTRCTPPERRRAVEAPLLTLGARRIMIERHAEFRCDG